MRPKSMNQVNSTFGSVLLVEIPDSSISLENQTVSSVWHISDTCPLSWQLIIGQAAIAQHILGFLLVFNLKQQIIAKSRLHQKIYIQEREKSFTLPKYRLLHLLEELEVSHHPFKPSTQIWAQNHKIFKEFSVLKKTSKLKKGKCVYICKKTTWDLFKA